MNRRCALVTGSSRGLGAVIARRLAADGWAVGVNHRANPELAEQVVADSGTRAGWRPRTPPT